MYYFFVLDLKKSKSDEGGQEKHLRKNNVIKPTLNLLMLMRATKKNNIGQITGKVIKDGEIKNFY